MAQDERTAQVTAAKRELRRRLDKKNARIERLEAQLAELSSAPAARPSLEPAFRRVLGRVSRLRRR
jgi:predicted nuclease with TOPRIM domain